jgi:hypothetical protein
MTGPTSAFSFLHDGRTYTCSVEGVAEKGRGPWWWFSVSTESNQRHAPFPAAPTDTTDDVRARIVAYYEALLARRAAPYQNPWQTRARQRPAAGGDAQPAPDVDAPVTGEDAPPE